MLKLHEYIKEILLYCPLTGFFMWIGKTRGNIKAGTIAGTKDKNGYIQIGINKKIYLAHRLAWLYMKGYFPEHEIDHINRIKDDNRWSNLRHVTRKCNAHNSNMWNTNTSGITEVYYNKSCNRWQAQIKVQQKLITLGSYKTKFEAAFIRWEAEKKYNFTDCNTISSAYQYCIKHMENAK